MSERESLLVGRKWDILSTRYGDVARWLDEGWEPFAVVQRRPNSDRTTTEPTVYLRRERMTEQPEAWEPGPCGAPQAHRSCESETPTKQCWCRRG